MGIPIDWKPEKAVYEKIRDLKKGREAASYEESLFSPQLINLEASPASQSNHSPSESKINGWSKTSRLW